MNIKLWQETTIVLWWKWVIIISSFRARGDSLFHPSSSLLDISLSSHCGLCRLGVWDKAEETFLFLTKENTFPQDG